LLQRGIVNLSASASAQILLQCLKTPLGSPRVNRRGLMRGKARWWIGPVLLLGFLAQSSVVPPGRNALQAQGSSPATDRDHVQSLLKQAAELVGPDRGDKSADVLAFLEPLLEGPAASEPALNGELHYWIATAYFRATKYD